MKIRISGPTSSDAATEAQATSKQIDVDRQMLLQVRRASAPERMQNRPANE